MKDTIFALSTGALPCGIAVMRISGPRTESVVERLVGKVPPPRMAHFTTIRRLDGSVLDRGLVLFFKGPSSFSGDDAAELHLHGSRAVVAAALQDLGALPGCRAAEPGEFTRRAFLNGRMTLLDAEQAATLVEAETEAQRRFAVEHGAERQARLYGAWRGRLLEARAMIEADLDFSDEGDVGEDAAAAVARQLDGLAAEIAAHLALFRKAEIVFDGFDVVLLGPPNAGKSSLLNAITGREAAIVTEEPGTTRDLVEIVVDLGGTKVNFVDTAGIRDQAGKVEAIGIERARARAARADLVLVLRAPDAAEIVSVPEGTACVSVATKIDLGTSPMEADFRISAMTGEGLGDLLDDIARRASALLPSASEIVPWRQRHVDLLGATLAQLRLAGGGPLELRAEHLRIASRELGRITGDISAEDMLDVIFSRFCIGK